MMHKTCRVTTSTQAMECCPLCDVRERFLPRYALVSWSCVARDGKGWQHGPNGKLVRTQTIKHQNSKADRTERTETTTDGRMDVWGPPNSDREPRNRAPGPPLFLVCDRVLVGALRSKRPLRRQVGHGRTAGGALACLFLSLFFFVRKVDKQKKRGVQQAHPNVARDTTTGRETCSSPEEDTTSGS